MSKKEKIMTEGIGKDRVQTFKNIVQNEPLVEVNPSLASINPEGVMDGKSIYYGTGLCTAKELSVALPFDVLGMVLVAEKIRRIMGAESKIYHHIADTHAKTNGLFNEQDIDRQARLVRDVLMRMAKNLGLANFEVVFASEFDRSNEYREIYENVKTEKHDYVRREVTDMEWYRRYKNVGIKIGWIIQASETDLGYDERVFDREYQEKISGDLSFIYLKPGRTFDKSRPKVSPYIHVSGESRILLQHQEDVKRKIQEAEGASGDKQLGGSRRHLTDIVRLYEKLFGSFGRIPLENEIEAIIEKVTKS